MATGSIQLLTQKFHLIWLADNIEELKKNYRQSFTHLQSIDSSIDVFGNANIFMDFFFLNSHEKIIMIVTGALGKDIVPIIHDASHLDSVFVFCHHKPYHEQWAKNYPKVKGVFNQIDVMCQAIEQAAKQPELIQSKSATVLLKPSPVVHRSVTPEPPGRTSRRDSMTAVDDQRLESRDRRRPRRDHSAIPNQSKVDRTTTVDDQRLKLRNRHGPRRDHSAIPIQSKVDTTASSQSHTEPMKIERHTPAAPLRRETDVKKDASVKPVTVTNNQHDTDRPRDNSSSDLINSKKPQSPLDYDRLERTLIATTEQKLRESLLINNDLPSSPSLDMNTIHRMQDTLVQTIEKYVPKKKDDSNVLDRLFADLKQVLVDTLVQQQQQPILTHDVIKQTVLDVLSEQKHLVSNSTTTTELPGHRKPVTIAATREVKITANRKLTRVDTAFRQERNAVVANKRLRDAVQKWSSVGSMVDLVTTIKTHGKNNLECAWLLFCWIGQNIRYDLNCTNNSAESVFRQRTGVCRGFVSLYHECCSLLNIECSEISGYAKQAFLKADQELRQSPHAWNSIVLDQYTYLIDPTWGAGARDNDKKLEDFYFLTSPEELIYTHYCNGSQLLEPEVSREDFLGLPVMKSTYYQLGLTLLSPKQGLNETNENLFKIAIRTPVHVDLFVTLKVNEIEYPRNLHTLCQRDETKSDVYNCYVAPPVNGLYEITVYAKTNHETLYHDAINMRLRVSNITDAFTFPLTDSTFTKHNCILIEPLQRLVYRNEEVLIHMIIPLANVIKIQNGDDYMVPGKDEYKRGVLRKKVRVQGDLRICARWDDKADSILVICVFNML
jgi:hypothetical protein